MRSWPTGWTISLENELGVECALGDGLTLSSRCATGVLRVKSSVWHGQDAVCMAFFPAKNLTACVLLPYRCDFGL
jgi:hypothetical protein